MEKSYDIWMELEKGMLSKSEAQESKPLILLPWNTCNKPVYRVCMQNWLWLPEAWVCREVNVEFKELEEKALKINNSDGCTTLWNGA